MLVWRMEHDGYPGFWVYTGLGRFRWAELTADTSDACASASAGGPWTKVPHLLWHPFPNFAVQYWCQSAWWTQHAWRWHAGIFFNVFNLVMDLPFGLACWSLWFFLSIFVCLNYGHLWLLVLRNCDAKKVVAWTHDCLQLWQTTLRNAPVMVPPLMSLFPHLVAVMELNFDHLQVCSWVTMPYFL